MKKVFILFVAVVMFFSCSLPDMVLDQSGDLKGTVPGTPGKALGCASNTFIIDMGNGILYFSVTLPSNQQYVEIFVRQNGIQNVAVNIAGNGRPNFDGTTTYTFIKWGYSIGDFVEYRFYSYLPVSPGVFTPGPIENIWLDYKYGVYGESVEIDTAKDANLVESSYGLGYVADRNFGDSATIDFAGYHYVARGIAGFNLSSIPAGALITKAELRYAVTARMGSTNYVNLGLVDASASWQENSVTWNNQPSAGDLGNYEFTLGAESSIDITDVVADAIGNNENEISFLFSDPSGMTNGMIASRENTRYRGAYLYVEYK
ncbi:MAG: DNRLRE domain-containing protein [Spirochaetales bacterium]|nr:DNRLRE domain-containing protein [Spirochaetales bacterium]